jgi:hypothetical protein
MFAYARPAGFQPKPPEKETMAWLHDIRVPLTGPVLPSPLPAVSALHPLCSPFTERKSPTEDVDTKACESRRDKCEEESAECTCTVASGSSDSEYDDEFDWDSTYFVSERGEGAVGSRVDFDRGGKDGNSRSSDLSHAHQQGCDEYHSCKRKLCPVHGCARKIHSRHVSWYRRTAEWYLCSKSAQTYFKQSRSLISNCVYVSEMLYRMHLCREAPSARGTNGRGRGGVMNDRQPRRGMERTWDRGGHQDRPNDQ